MNEVLSLLLNMFGSILELFDKVIDGLDAWDLMLGAFTCFIVFRFLLVPIVGGKLATGISDSVISKRRAEKGSDRE